MRNLAGCGHGPQLSGLIARASAACGGSAGGADLGGVLLASFTPFRSRVRVELSLQLPRQIERAGVQPVGMESSPAYAMRESSPASPLAVRLVPWRLPIRSFRTPTETSNCHCANSMSGRGGLSWAAEVGKGGRLDNAVALARGARKRDYGFPIRISIRQSLQNLSGVTMPAFRSSSSFVRPLSPA